MPPPPHFSENISVLVAASIPKGKPKEKVTSLKASQTRGLYQREGSLFGAKMDNCLFFISEIITLWCQAKQALRILPSSRLTTILILCLRALFMHQTANDVVLYRSHLFFFLFPWLPHLQPPLIVHWKTRWSDLIVWHPWGKKQKDKWGQMREGKKSKKTQ